MQLSGMQLTRFDCLSFCHCYLFFDYCFCFSFLFILDWLFSPMDSQLNVVERLEFSMIFRAMPSVVFNRFYQSYPGR